MEKLAARNQDAILILKSEFGRRHERNPRYSMRAFAKSIGLSHTILCLVLSGKRPLSKKSAELVSQRLALSPDQQKLLSASVTRGKAARKNSGDQRFQMIEMDLFHLISDWVHYAILSLAEIETKLLNPKRIASALQITESHAKLAFERLIEHKLIEKVDGRFKPTGHPIKFENSISTSGARKFQNQLMEKAILSLEADSFEIRDHSSTTMAIDPALIPYARQKIREFRRELTADLEARGNRSEVYNLTVQIYPVSKRKKK